MTDDKIIELAKEYGTPSLSGENIIFTQSELIAYTERVTRHFFEAYEAATSNRKLIGDQE